jgi:hypothetical protein
LVWHSAFAVCPHLLLKEDIIMGTVYSTKQYWAQTVIPDDDCPNAPNPQWAWRTDEDRNRHTVDHPSRTMPTQPLYEHPTELGLQWNERRIWGQRLKYNRGYWGACPYPNYKYMGFWQLYNDYTTYSHQGTSPDTNWQLDMRERIKRNVTSLGVAMAEYRKTSLLFYQGATALTDVYQALRKRKKSRRIDLSLCNLAMGHLAYDFGISPLMGDIHDAAFSLGFKLANNEPITLRHTVTKRAKSGGSNSQYEWEYDKSERAIVYVNVSPGKVKPIVVGSAGTIAWEIIPFSFVVDWMFPIGDWLASLDALDYIDGLTGTLTTKLKYSHKFVPGYFGDDTVIREPSYEYNSHKRTVLTTIPLPALPTYKPSTAFKNVLQGLSLLTILRKGCNDSSRVGR